MPAMYPLPAALFPTVKVHADHVAQCASTSERILESTMAARQEYVHRYNRQLDPATWRVVRRRRRSEDGVDMTVFQPQHKVRVPRPATTLSCSPILIAAGSMDGTLDDVMLGLTASTTSMMKLVTSSLHGGIPDARVLNRMDTPTEDDPFAFLGLKWFVRRSKNRLATLARPRDFVFLDASGIRTLPNGTRVGYQLMHSVDLPHCPPMPMSLNIVRAYMSFCFLFYENPTTKRVEMFCKGYVDPRGGLARRITVSVAADMILGCSNALQCARRKKIEWMLEEGATRPTPVNESDEDAVATCESQCRGSEQSDNSTTPSEILSTSSDDSLEGRLQATCTHHRHEQPPQRRRRSSVTAVWRSSGAATAESYCQLCSERVCAQCVRRVELPDNRGARSVMACLHCVEDVEAMDAAAFARRTVSRSLQFIPLSHAAFALNGGATGEKIRLAPIQKKRPMYETEAWSNPTQAAERRRHTVSVM
ncbi:hypothetical protein P43SY_000163 [Pythium insidiosum]|uniref:START domain-containing protein n=1 Tax=Pythium insidiosum TaxID=114742 RepID=A0AAD5LEQ0_PYTIN|nr:hypothetical protein P43SY_000163 [Pythium insidiosum]